MNRNVTDCVPHGKKRLFNKFGSDLSNEEVSGNAISPPKQKKTETMQINYKNIAKFRLKPVGEEASLSVESNDRVPLMLTDVQHLLLHSLLGNLNLSQPPRWYVLERSGKIKQTTCVILEGVSLQHWNKHKEEFIEINNIFSDYVEILTPSLYSGSITQELALVPLSEVEKEIIIHKYGSMDLALEARKDLMIMMRAVFPIGDDFKENTEIQSDDKFPRTQLILSAWQLIDQNYPVPLRGKLEKAYSDYVMTKNEYKPVTASSPMYGLDCEMCMTNAGSEVTHVSVVNEQHETIYETLVKPYNTITDYLTQYSGITKALLSDVHKRLEDVQQDIKELLPPDAILVGHSLNIDLHALKMMHPYVIDTSCIYNFTGERNRKPKLKVLAKEYLKKDIQTGKHGHNPVEDAQTSLRLVQLKLSKSMEFGDAVHSNRQKYKERAKQVVQTPEYALSIFNHIIEQKKTSLVVGCDDITGDYHTYMTQAKENLSSQLKKTKTKKVKLSTMDNREEVIATLSEAVTEYNFAMAHLKLAINNNEELKIMNTIDDWIKRIWSNLPLSALFVLVFGGTIGDNGVAMATIKSSSNTHKHN